MAELAKCTTCMLYDPIGVCGVKCNRKVASEAECIENLQELNRVLHRVGQDLLKDLKNQRNITTEAVQDLKSVASCNTCGNRTPFCDSNPDSCSGYVWRGPDPKKKSEGEEVFSTPVNQDLLQNAKDLIDQLTEALEKGAVPEQKTGEKSCLDMVADLYAALDASTIPSAEKQSIMRDLQRIKTTIWKYSA